MASTNSKSVAHAPSIKREREYPPSLWACPKCDTRVRTHVITFVVECRHRSHAPKGILMEVVE